jgi:hypothetical protein
VPGEFKVAELPSSKELQRLEGPELDKLEYGKFRTVMGKLTFIQEDLVAGQYTWQELSKEVCTPTEASMSRLKHFTRFLYGHRETVQRQKVDKNENLIRIKVDSNYAGENNDRRSKDCVHAFVHGALVSNSVKDQAFLAQSSCEAELAGSHRGAIMGIFLHNMWEEMFGEKLDIIIETDSSAARCVAMRQGIGRIRHLEVRQIYMQTLVKSERLVVKKLPGVDNTADLGTKPVTSATFYHLIELVGLRKFENNKLEVILPWRTKKIKSNEGHGSMAAMMMALVGALQIKETETTEIITNPVGEFMMTNHYKMNQAAHIIDSAANNFIVVGLCILALFGAIAMGVIATLGFQQCIKVVHGFAKEKENENQKENDKEKESLRHGKNKISFGGANYAGHVVPTFDMPALPTVELATSSSKAEPFVDSFTPTYAGRDPRLQGGFISSNGNCIHLSEACIILHSCHGVKAVRSYKSWCSKCTPFPL